IEGADERAREDWTTIVGWLGVSDVDFSRLPSSAEINALRQKETLTAEEQAKVDLWKRWRNAQEKWAAAFEKYLTEGRAPTAALARAFKNFKKWLIDIYRAVSNIVYTDADGNRQAFEMSDEIRGVMDRLLASEEEIEASRAVRESRELADEMKKQGIPDDATGRYRELIEQSAEKAKAKLFRTLMGELKDEKRAELAERRKEAKKRAAGEVWGMPEYKALKLFRTPRDRGGLRISVLDLTDIYGDEGTKKLLNELPFGVAANDGIGLEEAAELAGYPAGEALLEDLKKTKALETAMTGVAPERVETVPIRTKSGRVLRGGYYPVRFDISKSWKAETQLKRGRQWFADHLEQLFMSLSENLVTVPVWNA
ncbi:MAG: hypothetical protein LBO82_00745, partial [Synergistaceae bacterium]|nr:hypothetical protein [Synergistaceae bacterium]